MFGVLFGIIVVIAIIGFSKHIYKKNVGLFTKYYYSFPKSIREKIKGTDPYKDLIWFIHLLLFIFIIFQLGAILAFKFGSHGAAHALIKTIFFWFGTEAGYGKLGVMLFSSIALLIVSYNLSKFLNLYRKRNDLKGTNAVIELRKSLDSNDKSFEIHRDLHFGSYEFIENPSTKEEETRQMELFRYLGIIGMAGSMVRKGIISIEQFSKLFGDRTDAIVSCKLLKEYLLHNKRSWTDLLWVIREKEKAEKDNVDKIQTNDPKDKMPHHESELFVKGRNLMKKGGKYLFDDK